MAEDQAIDLLVSEREAARAEFRAAIQSAREDLLAALQRLLDAARAGDATVLEDAWESAARARLALRDRRAQAKEQLDARLASAWTAADAVRAG